MKWVELMGMRLESTLAQKRDNWKEQNWVDWKESKWVERKSVEQKGNSKVEKQEKRMTERWEKHCVAPKDSMSVEQKVEKQVV
jgi:hypothetical protein